MTPEERENLLSLCADVDGHRNEPIERVGMFYRNCAIELARFVRSVLQPESATGHWNSIHTLDTERDDLMWFCRGDTYEGPRVPKVDDADYWDWWCFAKPPALPKGDAT